MPPLTYIHGFETARIAEDYDIFDFSLTPEDMHRFNDLECGHRFASY